jgi:hypothetical protein
MSEENKLVYKDEEGNKLYGFSQRSLDKNTMWIKLAVIVFGSLLALIISIGVWGILQFSKYHFLSLLIEAIGRC